MNENAELFDLTNATSFNYMFAYNPKKEVSR